MRFALEVAYTSRELARIRQDVAHADTTVLSSSAPTKERSSVIRAYIYVWLSALLERVVRDSIRDTLRELTRLGVPCNELRAGLFALLCEPELQSIADRGRQSGLSLRVDLFNRLFMTSLAEFSEEVLPMDGKTIRGAHFETIWRIFELSGSPLPAPSHKVALKDLADGRNEVAHGHSDPSTFGRTKATADLYSLVGRVDEVIVHLLNALDDYLQQKYYKR